MQVDNKLLDDLARVAAGAAGTVSGLRDEIEAQMRQRMERLLARMDVVSREEFEVVRELAANARREQEALEKKVAALERRLAEFGGPPTPKPAPKPAPPAVKKRAAPKAGKPPGKVAARRSDKKPD